MSRNQYDNFPSGALTYSLKIDQNNLNQRFKWILTMFRHFQSRMKSFEDRMSLASFQNSTNPLLFTKVFEKVGKETLDKMHEERTNVYWDLYNGLSKDITEKFTAAVLLQQQKRLQQTRVLILGNISASAKTINQLSDEVSRTKLKINHLSKLISQHQQKFKNEVNVVTKQIKVVQIASQTNNQKVHSTSQTTIKTQIIEKNVQSKITSKIHELSQMLEYQVVLLNKKYQNLFEMISNQSQRKTHNLGDEQDQDQYQDKVLITSNRSMSPSIRKKSQIMDHQNSIQIQRIIKDVASLNQKLMLTQQSHFQISQIREKVLSLEKYHTRNILDPSQQDILKQKVSNHLTEMFQKPFQQKFSKSIIDSCNKMMVDLKFSVNSYMKQINKKLQQRPSGHDIQNWMLLQEEKISTLERLLDKKVNIIDIQGKIRKIQDKIQLIPKKQRVKTEQKMDVCLSCREPKTQFLFRRSSLKKMNTKLSSQSFHISSYPRKLF